MSASKSSGGSQRKSRFSLRSIFGSSPPATFTQLAARLVERQEASPSTESSTVPPTSRQNSTYDVELARGGSLSESASTSAKDLKSSSKRGGTMECPLCFMDLHKDCFPKLTLCAHRACWNCLQRYLRIEISEGRVNIDCPECAEIIHPNDIRSILSDDATMLKYEAFMLRRVLATDRDARWCPAPDCTFVVIANNCATCPKLKCQRPGCNTEFCYHCKQEWHPNITCDMARQQRSEDFPTITIPGTSSRPQTGTSSSKLLNKEEIKHCPSCGMQIIKADDGSCNHMTCGICGKEFCWLCEKQITDLHYLSPSGCTFWGKEPWSKKKKILWQLGMLIGAPVGIALIAGIAIPGIIIGIPVFVGKKMYAKYRERSTTRRNVAVGSGVVLSMLVSPIIAAVAIGIGVPILLAYAYGVVPLSLIRSAGGCGLSASSSGVRLQFDETNNTSEDRVVEDIRNASVVIALPYEQIGGIDDHPRPVVTLPEDRTAGPSQGRTHTIEVQIEDFNADERHS